MTPTPHASRLRPVTGLSRTNPESGVRGFIRTVVKTLAVATAGTLIATLAPGAANAYLEPNETTDWIVVDDSRGDQTIAPAKFNKRGKQVNQTTWDPARADLENVQYVWDRAVQSGQDDLHLLVFDNTQAHSEPTYTGKRSSMVWRAVFWLDGQKTVTLTSAAGISRVEYVKWEDPADAQAYYSRKDVQTCVQEVGNPMEGTRWLAFAAKCLPQDAAQITKIEFASEIWAVNKKSLGKVAVTDTAEIVANIPVRQ